MTRALGGILARASLVAALALTAVGCGGLEVDMSKVVAPPAHADDAMLAIQNIYLLRSMPVVHWYGDAALTCDSGRGQRGFWYKSDGCVVGEQEHGEIIVAAPAGKLISEERDQFGYVVLAHEMEHEALEQRTGDPCTDHKCPGFAPGGEADQATDFLVRLGI